tara:strand:+ start:63 stop:278 length:216 start_codon:yes stop_codon:yes gene_type:complete
MKKKNLNAKKSLIGDIVSNGILTPNRIDELFIQAIGDVLNEIEENKKEQIQFNKRMWNSRPVKHKKGANNG